MAPLIPAAKIELSYPLYCCDFDPEDDGRLVVGGGGGSGKTGVGNKIVCIGVFGISIFLLVFCWFGYGLEKQNSCYTSPYVSFLAFLIA